VNQKKQLKKAYASKKKNIAGNSKGSDLGSINGASMEVHTAGTSPVDNNMTNITASTTGTTDDMNTQGMEDNPLDPGICHESAFPGTISSIQQPAEGFKDDLSKQVRIHQEDSSWVDKRMVMDVTHQ
jgi:hypothetical protein